MDPNQEQQEGTLTPSFPAGRIKKIVKLDGEIKKLNAEALHLISLSTDLFLGSLAEISRVAAISKKRRIIKLDHIRSAVRGHAPTSDFLLDCLPNPDQPPPATKADAEMRKPAVCEKPLPPGASRIDDFLRKSSKLKE